MADRLIFPIGFDIETARKDAEAKIGDMLKRVNDLLRKNPVKVHMALDSGGVENTVYDFFRLSSSVKGINDQMKKLRDTWNNMRFDKKFDADGNMTAKAIDLVQKFTQLTEATKRYGMTLDEATKQSIKAIDDEVKAQEKMADEINKTQAQITRDRLAQIEARKKAEMAAMKELEKRYAEQQRMYDKLFAKIDIPKGIDAGFTSGASNIALGKKLAQYTALRKELDEIDRKFARIQATGAAFTKQGEPTARAIPLLERRAQIEQEIASITRTAAEAQKIYAKQQADAAKAEERAIREKQSADAEWVRNFIANREKEAQAHARRIQQIQAEIAAQAKLKAEMQAMYNELFTRAGQKGINVGFIDTAKVERDTAYIRERYRTLLHDLNILAQTRYNVKISIDKEFEPEIRRLTDEINRLGQHMMRVGSKGGDVRPFLDAIQQLRNEIDAINRKKIDIFNNKAINSEYQALRTQVSELYNAMADGQNKIASDNKVNEALGRQIEKVEQLRAKIAELDAQYARLNAQGGAMTAAGRATPEALRILNERKKAEEEIARITTTAEEAQRQAAERTARARELWAQRAREQAKRQAEEERKLAEEQLRIQEKINAKRQAKAAKQADETRQIQQRIASLKRERAALVAKENTIANINAKLAAYNAQLQRAEIGGKTFERISKEVERLSKKLDQINSKTVAPKGVKETTAHFREQTTYVERLLKRLAVYASFSAIVGFAAKVRDVTAQFELQRVSLGAIIQDQVRANQLFSEIKQFALKSPITIMDLTKYVKQVAAYRIETDKLFDTTKRLADVSVGLGVDMGRIVLAYGQVKAASYLRATEIRQFTEAGIPLLELLAEKFSELNGEAVSTEKVMDMVSKRMVGFEMVEQIFNDMTSAGGMFFNMQEKQGNTLYGMWAKLGDAASVMYDQIGNTGYVNSAMKGLIQSLTLLFRNWRDVAVVISSSIMLYGVYRLTLAATAVNVDKVRNATNLYAAKMDVANKRLASSNVLVRTSGQFMKFQATAAYQAAAATTALGRAWGFLKSAMIQTGIGALIVALGYLVDKLFFAKSAAQKLKEALEGIDTESGVEQMKSVRNFESLANVAVKAADGSKQQKDALDELHRTYKDIIPLEQMTIENLRQMNGNYITLTQSIKDYVAERMKQKKIDKIIEETGVEMLDSERKIKDIMKDTWNYEQIERYMSAFEKLLRENPQKKTSEVMAEAAEISGIGWQNMLDLGATTRDKLDKAIRSFAKPLREQVAQINAVESAWTRGYEALDTYGSTYKQLAETVENKPITSVGGVSAPDGSYLQKQQRQNLQVIEAIVPILKQILADAEVTWQDGWANLITDVDASAPNIISAINFDAVDKYLRENITNITVNQSNAIKGLRKIYEGIGIPSEVVQHNRTIAIDLANDMSDALSKIGDGTKSAIDNITKYLQAAGQSNKDYAKVLDDALKDLQERATELRVIAKILSPEGRKELEDLETAIDYVTRLRASINTEVESASGGRKEDQRLQNAQNVISELEKLYNKRLELEKYMSHDTAVDELGEKYKGAIAEINKWAKKAGVNIESSLVDEQRYLAALRNIKKYIEKLPKSERAVIDLEAKIGDAQFKKLQKDLEEKIKQLADRVAATNVAKEFFDKILSQTGDLDIAASVSLAVYGDTGAGLFDDMVAQIKQAFESENIFVGLEVSSVIDTTNQVIDYKKLADIYKRYEGDLLEANRKTAQDIIKNGQKAAAEEIEGWYKKYAKAKNIEEQITDVIKREAEVRAAIIKSNLPEDEKKSLLGASYEQQRKEISALNYQAFKESDSYIKIFENLDKVSTGSLKRLREELQKIIDTNHDLSPQNMKEVVKAMERIDEQLQGRGFGKGMVQSVRDWREARKQLIEAQQELQAAQADYEAQEPALNEDIRLAEEAKLADQEELNRLKADELATDEQIRAAQLQLNASAKQVALAEQKKANAAKVVKKAEDKVEEATDGQRRAISDFNSDMLKTAKTADDLASILGDVSELLGLSEDSVAGLAFGAAIEGLQTFSKALTTVVAIEELANIVAESNPYIAAGAALMALFAGMFSFLSGNKVRRANNIIKEQQKIIDDLEHAYERLEDRMEKVFGGDYISNFNVKIGNLQAQIEAYQKQLDAEQSKGKKADEEKLKEYTEAIRDAKEEIEDMRTELSEKFLGSDLADAARDFASAWLDAYKEFGNTTDAIKSKFKDMMENMIVESVMGQVMKRALQPVFDIIDNMSDGDFYDKAFWANVATAMDKATANASAGANNAAKMLESAGLNLRADADSFTGISRDIATASEESINGLAAGINTQNFYISQIHANVQGIYSILSSNSLVLPSAATEGSGVSLTDLVTLQNKHLSHLPNISANTADTVARLDSMLAMLNRVIQPRGVRTTFVVNTSN